MLTSARSTSLLLVAACLLGACVAPGSGPESSDPASSLDKENAAQLTHDGKADQLGGDVCDENGWYHDAECDWFCARPDPDCGALESGAAPAPEPVGAATRFPIVFHHGFAGGHEGIFAWNDVEGALGQDGHAVYVTEVPPFDSVAVRSEYLRTVIDRALAETGAAKVHVIAHSMGGLDARHVISVLGYGDRVASLTTISTPHRGTAVADLGLRAVPGVADAAVDALFGLIGRSLNDAADSTDVRAALVDLSEANAAQFDAAHPDDARVYYQSYAGVSSLLGLARYRRDPAIVAACDGIFLFPEGSFDRFRPAFWPVAPVVGHGTDKRPQDGLVTVESSRYGTFRGCIAADHSEEVGQYVGGDGPNGRTGFDHRAFYRELAFELAASE